MANNIKNNFKIIALASMCLFALNFTLTKAEEIAVPIEETAVPAEAVPAAGNPDGQTETSVAPASEAPETGAVTTGAPAAGDLPGQVDIVEPVKSEPLIIGTDNNTGGLSQTSLTVDPDDTSAAAGETADEIGDNSTAAPVSPDNHDINTGIIRNLYINNLTIIGEWQMSASRSDGSYLGADDSLDSRGQFLPSGRYQADKPLEFCALVGDINGTTDINSVKAVINYPAGIAVSKNDSDEQAGCGRLKSEVSLVKLDKNEAMALLCDTIRNNNNNLIKWNLSQADNFAYGYDQACGEEGYINQETVGLFCGEMPLSYDDPAGTYRVKIAAQNSGNLSAISENSFKYLELTTFENDFTDIQYGPVKSDELKILQGDLIWGSQTGPTIRNTGNTRLQIKIRQNDFGFGKTGGEWNISYQARVGGQSEFIKYPPEQSAILNDFLNLGETANMDFGALIYKFPDTNSNSAFWGNMILSADKAEPLACK